MGCSVPLQVNIQGNSHSGVTFFDIFTVIVYVAIHDEIHFPCHSFFVNFVDNQIILRFASNQLQIL